MKKNRSIVKIKRPALAKVFSRKRLFNLLDSKRDKKVIWVTGPPGKRAEAITVYKRCREILSTVLGIKPSPETEAVYKAVL